MKYGKLFSLLFIVLFSVLSFLPQSIEHAQDTKVSLISGKWTTGLVAVDKQIVPRYKMGFLQIDFTVDGDGILGTALLYVADSESEIKSGLVYGGGSWAVYNQDGTISASTGGIIGQANWLSISFAGLVNSSSNLEGIATIIDTGDLLTKELKWKAEPVKSTGDTSSRIVSNGTYDLEVTKVEKVTTIGADSAVSGSIFIIVDIEIIDPEFKGNMCGKLQDGAGNSWETFGVNVGLNKSNKLAVTGCIYYVPDTANNLEWHPVGYPSIALSF